MAHKEQRDFCLSVKSLFPQKFEKARVLDVGSLDVNGTNRHLFGGCDYTGLDIAAGKNVDVVCCAHEYKPGPIFDIVICTEMLEHDQQYPDSLRAMVGCLKPGGLLIITCATTGRPEHGTRRTTPQDSPLTTQVGGWQDYYKNLTESDVRAVLDVSGLFSQYAFSVHAGHRDLQFWGVTKG